MKAHPPAPANNAAGLTDRIELMYTFVRIVEAGSMSAAALQMGTSQPTVSRRLQLLERSLGLRLLQRSTHAMKLTEDGERCYERAKELLADWGAFEADLRGAGTEAEGHLRVVAPHAFGQQHLVTPLARFMRENPKVTVDWQLHDRGPDFVVDGVDCAIQVGAVSDPSAVAIRVAEVPRIVVAAPALLAGVPPVVHARDLAGLPWLSLTQFYRKEITLTHVSTGETCRLRFQPRLSTDSLYAMRSAAVAGVGVGVSSTWLLDDNLADGSLQQLLPQWQAEPLPVYIVYPHARYYPAKLRRFVDLMRESMPTAMDTTVARSNISD